ncbi:MAG: NADH-quinone oxidoreductase subunit L [Acidobacteria bacterium]|nr:NADH-quinone oxidoreductase subunit L [Acidobacteriota bacterium]
MNLWLIPIFPLLGSAINGVFGRRLPKQVVNLVAVGSVLLSFLWVLKTLSAAWPLESAVKESYFTWIQSGNLQIGCDLMVDRLTAVMLLVVTGVGALIHIYAIGYMAHEGGYYRFFSYLNLFMFFMLVLVLGANFLLLFVGWEGVGLCSYLLIGFYFLEKFAGDAGKKAFIVNRIGDFGFSLAMFLIFVNFGTLDFGRVFTSAKSMTPEAGVGVITVICLLLMVGAAGKSAQLPLYVWLPDAMAGPTPVSALIHAATMVTAGVYMVTRSAALFHLAPVAMNVVAIIGLATAFFAATIGLVQNDIKKVYAYSTVSQLGYMFLGCGAGAFSAGIFHVMTHAFFKALLFLGAGSVIHACAGEQDLRYMGGLRKYTPITMITLLCASVAIAGVPPFSGFFSKDEILAAAYEHAPWMYWVGVFTAGMTAFYVFRAFFLAFAGQYRGPNPHAAGHGHGDDHGHGHGKPHESPLVMTVPLMILAIGSLAGGFINIPKWLEPMYPLAEGPENHMLVYISVAAGLIGIAIAFFLYVVKPSLAESLASALSGPYKLLYNKYFVDEVYDATIVHPLEEGSRTVLWRGVDAGVIDGTVNGVGARARGMGNVLRLLQGGNIGGYAAWVVLGSLLVILYVGLGVGR